MNHSSPKVGVVIVSHNADLAVRITLASLRRARNDTCYELILVDNASTTAERSRIRNAMSHHIADVGPAWRYIEQQRNLGFSGGNNVGIADFLSSGDITHICLLNSDVIVTDHWLDRLMAAKADIVSAVTNKSESEQCVPVDYRIELSECLGESRENISDHIWETVSEFAQRWHVAWKGNTVSRDVTFFCVLMTAEACRNIGFLDETFFPGGFEDDDYCVRARQAGYDIQLARDVFIHHWGSASFGQLRQEYFSERAKKNKDYLERKHNILWERRPEKPIISFSLDVAYMLSQHDRSHVRNQFFSLYVDNIRKQITYFESEFRHFRHILQSSGRPAPEALVSLFQIADAYGPLEAGFDGIVEEIRTALESAPVANEKMIALVSRLETIASGIHARVEFNFATLDFSTSAKPAGGGHLSRLTRWAQNKGSRLKQRMPMLLSRLKNTAGAIPSFCRFFINFDGIVFFGGYFYPERQGDGYFQRIEIIDRIFSDRWRIYVESDELRGRETWFDIPQPNILVLRLTGKRKRKRLARIFAILAALRCRNVYFHSVLRLDDHGFGRLLQVPFLRRVVDLHGVVPEEFRMHDDYFNAVRYEKQEAIAVRRSDAIVVVSEVMHRYYRNKFQGGIKAKVVSLPMVSEYVASDGTPALQGGKPVVVYAGGLHKWQQVHKMIDAILRTHHLFEFRFYCSEPRIVKDLLPPKIAQSVIVESRTHNEIMDIYKTCHYGFILRSDSIVNRVSCPTKLVEYLAMGVVPVVDSAEVGDFGSFGMRSVSLADFLSGQLPAEAERQEMARANHAVYERLRAVRHTGIDELRSFFPASAKPRGAMPFTAAARGSDTISPALIEDAGPCDILVQVDNFEAGGLENIVLDLNDACQRKGYRIVLLVLGSQGKAVERARASGQSVICCSYVPEAYEAILDRLHPKIVLTHYSINGIDVCARKAIPIVQIIHNIYMWLDEHQRRAFANAAEMTTQFVAYSEFARSYSATRLGVPPGKCHIIPIGIDLAPFEMGERAKIRGALRNQLGFTEDEFVFLDIGAINHQKNHLGAIKAFEIAVRTCTNARLVIIGPCYEKTLLDELQEYVESRSLQDRILYCGGVPRAHEYLMMADAFVSSSFFEGGPLCLLEAIAADIPVISPLVGFAERFAGKQGIHLIEPAVDLNSFHARIQELTSTSRFEQQLANAMVATWQDPVRPSLSLEERTLLGKEHAYEAYVALLADILGRPHDATAATLA